MIMKILSLSLLYLSFAFSQRPNWTNETPTGYTHDYFVGVGSSSVSESDARNSALADALQRIVQSGRITLQGSQSMSSLAVEKFKDGESTSFDAIDKVVNDIRIVGESESITGLREEENYSEEHDGIFVVWSLMKIPKRSPLVYEEPSVVSPVWRSAILPSWGQFYKGQPTKGVVVAISIAALVPTAIAFNNLHNTSRIDAKNARTQSWRDYYTKQSNDYKNAGLACLSVAGAVYIYNIIDAIVSKGEKEYVDLPDIQLNSPTIAGITTTSVSVHIAF